MKQNWKTVPNLILIIIFLGTAVPTLTLPLTGEWDFDKIEKNGSEQLFFETLSTAKRFSRSFQGLEFYGSNSQSILFSKLAP